MNKKRIYLKEWMQLHPYVIPQPSDAYFINVANQLYHICTLPLPEEMRKKVCLYITAYIEDQVSGLGLWQSFIKEHTHLYNTALPFYNINNSYDPKDVNEEDIRFIIWNAWEKAMFEHPYTNPNNNSIIEQARTFFPLVVQTYEEAPENPIIANFFNNVHNIKDAEKKVHWLFAHTYLTEPSMQIYLDHISPEDQYTIPFGPLALFMHEWIALLSDNPIWKTYDKLYPSIPEASPEMKEKNRSMFHHFTEGTNGKNIVYLNGYAELHRFLIHVLKWQDDENHTLPQMKPFRNFILMSNPEKGILLAKDICEYISDKDNPLYNKSEAKKNAFRLLTEERLCPPDLLTYCIRHNLIPDATFPDGEKSNVIQENADFIARHALLYFYRGD